MANQNALPSPSNSWSTITQLSELFQEGASDALVVSKGEGQPLLCREIKKSSWKKESSRSWGKSAWAKIRPRPLNVRRVEKAYGKESGLALQQKEAVQKLQALAKVFPPAKEWVPSQRQESSPFYFPASQESKNEVPFTIKEVQSRWEATLSNQENFDHLVKELFLHSAHWNGLLSQKSSDGVDPELAACLLKKRLESKKPFQDLASLPKLIESCAQEAIALSKKLLPYQNETRWKRVSVNAAFDEEKSERQDPLFQAKAKLGYRLLVSEVLNDPKFVVGNTEAAYLPRKKNEVVQQVEAVLNKAAQRFASRTPSKQARLFLDPLVLSNLSHWLERRPLDEPSQALQARLLKNFARTLQKPIEKVLVEETTLPPELGDLAQHLSLILLAGDPASHSEVSESTIQEKAHEAAELVLTMVTQAQKQLDFPSVEISALPLAGRIFMHRLLSQGSIPFFKEDKEDSSRWAKDVAEEAYETAVKLQTLIKKAASQASTFSSPIREEAFYRWVFQENSFSNSDRLKTQATQVITIAEVVRETQIFEYGFSGKRSESPLFAWMSHAIKAHGSDEEASEKLLDSLFMTQELDEPLMTDFILYLATKETSDFYFKYERQIGAAVKTWLAKSEMVREFASFHAEELPNLLSNFYWEHLDFSVTRERRGEEVRPGEMDEKREGSEASSVDHSEEEILNSHLERLFLSNIKLGVSPLERRIALERKVTLEAFRSSQKAYQWDEPLGVPQANKKMLRDFFAAKEQYESGSGRDRDVWVFRFHHLEKSLTEAGQLSSSINAKRFQEFKKRALPSRQERMLHSLSQMAVPRSQEKREPSRTTEMLAQFMSSVSLPTSRRVSEKEVAEHIMQALPVFLERISGRKHSEEPVREEKETPHALRQQFEELLGERLRNKDFLQGNRELVQALRTQTREERQQNQSSPLAWQRFLHECLDQASQAHNLNPNLQALDKLLSEGLRSFLIGESIRDLLRSSGFQTDPASRSLWETIKISPPRQRAFVQEVLKEVLKEEAVLPSLDVIIGRAEACIPHFLTRIRLRDFFPREEWGSIDYFQKSFQRVGEALPKDIREAIEYSYYQDRKIFNRFRTFVQAEIDQRRNLKVALKTKEIAFLVKESWLLFSELNRSLQGFLKLRQPSGSQIEKLEHWKKSLGLQPGNNLTLDVEDLAKQDPLFFETAYEAIFNEAIRSSRFRQILESGQDQFALQKWVRDELKRFVEAEFDTEESEWSSEESDSESE